MISFGGGGETGQRMRTLHPTGNDFFFFVIDWLVLPCIGAVYKTGVSPLELVQGVGVVNVFSPRSFK